MRKKGTKKKEREKEREREPAGTKMVNMTSNRP